MTLPRIEPCEKCVSMRSCQDAKDSRGDRSNCRSFCVLPCATPRPPWCSPPPAPRGLRDSMLRSSRLWPRSSSAVSSSVSSSLKPDDSGKSSLPLPIPAISPPAGRPSSTVLWPSFIVPQTVLGAIALGLSSNKARSWLAAMHRAVISLLLLAQVGTSLSFSLCPLFALKVCSRPTAIQWRAEHLKILASVSIL